MPIAPGQLVEGMGRWERYLHSHQPDALVQLAIAHAEFESLHPFLDGNGRLGRMLIPLFLFERKLLQAPMFYLSEYLESRREQYCGRLLAVSQDDDWTGWCEFFLTAVTQQANENESKVRRILNLYDEKKRWVVEATHSQHAITALDFLFDQPVFSGSQFTSKAGLPPPSARRILKLMSDSNLLRTVQEASGRRPAVYAFHELLNTAEGHEAF